MLEVVSLLDNLKKLSNSLQLLDPGREQLSKLIVETARSVENFSTLLQSEQEMGALKKSVDKVTLLSLTKTYLTLTNIFNFSFLNSSTRRCSWLLRVWQRPSSRINGTGVIIIHLFFVVNTFNVLRQIVLQ